MIPRGTDYLLAQQHDFAIYVMRNRAIPSITDGMKSSIRRILWMARDGNKYKSAVLSGSTLPLHPHDSPEDALNTMTAPYGNNIPLLTGYGAFGTLLAPRDFGAGRYTSVKLSKFSEDVILKDIEIIPMMENYDHTLMEPVHFLPLIPLVLLNPQEGIAVGFATNILPRSLDDIIKAQISFLSGKELSEDIMPKFNPLRSVSHISEVTDNGRRYYFNGEFTRVTASTIKIHKIPFGQPRSAVISKLEDEVDKGDVIVDYLDDSSDAVDITVTFKKGVLKRMDDAVILKMLGLVVRHCENMNVLNFSGKTVWTTNPIDLIVEYTKWRLGFYTQRYLRLIDITNVELQKLLDIKLAVEKNVGGTAKKTKSRSELKEYIAEIGVVYVDYIADLPVYRFTEEEKNKCEEKITETRIKLSGYMEIVQSEDKRKSIYLSELQEALTNYNKGKYNNDQTSAK